MPYGKSFPEPVLSDPVTTTARIPGELLLVAGITRTVSIPMEMPAARVPDAAAVRDARGGWRKAGDVTLDELMTGEFADALATTAPALTVITAQGTARLALTREQDTIRVRIGAEDLPLARVRAADLLAAAWRPLA